MERPSTADRSLPAPGEYPSEPGGITSGRAEPEPYRHAVGFSPKDTPRWSVGAPSCTTAPPSRTVHHDGAVNRPSVVVPAPSAEPSRPLRNARSTEEQPSQIRIEGENGTAESHEIGARVRYGALVTASARSRRAPTAPRGRSPADSARTRTRSVDDKLPRAGGHGKPTEARSTTMLHSPAPYRASQPQTVGPSSRLPAREKPRSATSLGVSPTPA